MVKYIRTHVHRPIHIKELISEACLSRAQFFKAFQREMGESPLHFINRERLQLAKRKLLSEGKSVTDACFESGFSSLNYFSRLFRKMEGITPTEWRTQQINKMRCSVS